ncbi:hypothetical protein IFM89_036583 [Coptis chinensis]|uniref:Protein kinase domain-containing protein n=1 Tax=Coptis chinensis TaxID=261450 RepID=A0A835HEX8_9MAGN|nr:hypothetical protein IFM89_036583 [Coptis chinensis]
MTNITYFHTAVREDDSVSTTSTDDDGASSVVPTAASQAEGGISALEFYLKSFSFKQLKAATRNFCSDTLLGEGAFGLVYKGWIDQHNLTPTKPGTGVAVAVKMHKPGSCQLGLGKLLTEKRSLGHLYHPNLVSLVGYCLEDGNSVLVYEFVPRGSLDNHLFGRGSNGIPLSWSIRMKVALGAAKGLAFLHSTETNVIHRDFNSSNILLDLNYSVKLSGFGLAKNGPIGDESHVSTRVMGTYGYAAPEYVSTGHLTAKSDVYGFGVVLLEILCGRRAVDRNRPSVEHNLVEWAKPYLKQTRKIVRVLDIHLKGQYSLGDAKKIANIALQCTSNEAKHRPKMDEIVKALEELQVSIYETHPK